MLDPKSVIKIITVRKDIAWRIIISKFCMDSLWFRFEKILVSVGETLWHPHGSQSSAILKIWHCGSNFALVYAIVHEKPWMNIRVNWHNCPWQSFRSFDGGIVILSVFMAPDRVVLPASRNKSHRKLLTCFLGRVALGLSFRERKRRNDLMTKFVHSAPKTMFY